MLEVTGYSKLEY